MPSEMDMFCKTGHQMESNIGSETLIMQLENGQYYAIDGTARAIWDSIDGPTTLEKIVGSLMESHNIDRETCTKDVAAFLEELLDQGLISRTDTAS